MGAVWEQHAAAPKACPPKNDASVSQNFNTLLRDLVFSALLERCPPIASIDVNF
jgi:hypothetical protein